MNINGLSFNALPPIDLPFRFFITAPLFVILMAILVLFSGEDLWISRWHPSMLALTHGFTLGFISSVMMGALLQLLPVLGGIGFAKPRLIAGSCHLFHLLGTLFLITAFIFPTPLFFTASILFLSLGLGGYIAAAAWVLIKKLSQGDSIIGIRFAITGFLVLLLLGLLIQAEKAGYLTNDLTSYLTNNLTIVHDKALTNLHALWGLVGWASLLIISVSFQVIPMFHVAPAFQPIIRRHIVWLLFVLLMLFALFPTISLPIIIILHGVFAFALLITISKRKRKVPDTTIRYWQLGAYSLLVLNGFYFLPNILINQLPEPLATTLIDKKSMIMAAIFIYFYLVAVIQGMLLKIMPFLSYTHLQQSCLMNFSAMQFIPHMHEFLAKKHASKLFILHLITGLALIGTLLAPALYWLFGSLLLIEFSGLLWLMVKVIRLYNTAREKIKLVDE